MHQGEFPRSQFVGHCPVSGGGTLSTQDEIKRMNTLLVDITQTSPVRVNSGGHRVLPGWSFFEAHNTDDHSDPGTPEFST